MDNPQTQAHRQMNATDKKREWARHFKACLSPTSRLGSLRGAERDGVLAEVCKELGLTNIRRIITVLSGGMDGNENSPR